MAILVREMSAAEVRNMSSRDNVNRRRVANGGGSGGGGGGENRHRTPGAHQSRTQAIVYRLHLHPTQSEISCCVKYTVFGFNTVFWLIGFLLVGIGLWAQIEKNPFSELGPTLSKFYLDPTWILLIIGFVVFVLGFSGCVGALRENTCLLAFYAILLGVLLLCQLGSSVLAFMSKNWLRMEMEKELDAMIVAYRDDPDLQSVIDWIQKDWLHCCGIQSPDDWDMNVYFNKSASALKSPEAGGVPFSCCDFSDIKHESTLVNLYCGHGVRLENYHGSQAFYETGCLPMLVEWFNRNIMQVGVALIVVTVMEILGICFAQNLRQDIFAQRARWLYTH